MTIELWEVKYVYSIFSESASKIEATIYIPAKHIGDATSAAILFLEQLDRTGKRIVLIKETSLLMFQK